MNNVSAFSEEGDSNWMFGTDKGVKKQVGGVNSAHNNAVDQITVLEATSKEHKNRKQITSFPRRCFSRAQGNCSIHSNDPGNFF